MGEGERTELGKCVRDSLICGEEVWKTREDACGERDIAGFHADVRVLGEGPDDGQERIGGKSWGFVGEGVNDSGNLEHE